VNPTDDELAELLRTARRIAVVGLSPDPDRPSNGVTRYLQAVGYEIIPVNGKFAGGEILGVPVVAKVTDIPGKVDIVNLFRRSVDVPRPVDEAIAAGAGSIWMQLGIRNEEVASKAEAAGLTVVMNRCIAVDHRRLIRG
jgi:predicted CoA-binding protein